MKKELIKGLLLVLTVSLVGCSSNTQNQNTAAGVVTGAVVGGVAGGLIGQGGGQAVAIGAGAVVGALVGGVIGHSMDSTDSANMYRTLDNNAKNKPSHWRNPKTHAKYTMVPTSDRMTINGNTHCRKYRTIAVIHGKKHHVYGVACRQSDGTWQAVNP